MNRTPQSWAEKRTAGALFRDVKSAFNNVSKAYLGRRMEALELEPDLVRWTSSFMTDQQVKIVLGGEVGQANPVDTGIPQGSPATPVLFITYLSGIFDEVERVVPGIKGLSFADDTASWAEGEGDRGWQPSCLRQLQPRLSGRPTAASYLTTERLRRRSP
jgi:hypothetical protein